MQENDLALMVPYRMQCKIDQALGSIRPMVRQVLAIRHTQRGLLGCVSDLSLHLLRSPPPPGLPKQPPHHFFGSVTAGVQAQSIGVNDFTVHGHDSGEYWCFIE